MPLILDVSPVPGGQFEALVVEVPYGTEDATADAVRWSGIFDTEDEARREGQKELDRRRGR